MDTPATGAVEAEGESGRRPGPLANPRRIRLGADGRPIIDVPDPADR